MSAIVRAADFSPDGRFLATASGEPKRRGMLVVWDVISRKPHFVHEEAVGIPAVAFGPDGKHLAIGLFAPLAKLLDAESGIVVRTFEGHGNHVRSVAFSKSGDRLVTASYDRTVRLWDVSTGKPLMSFEGHTDTVMSAAIAGDDGPVVSCGNDQTTRVWDLATGKELRSLKPTTLVVRKVSFSPDSRFFCTCHWDGFVRIRESETAQLRGRIATGGGAEWAQFSPDGRTLAVCTLTPVIQLFDVALNEPSPDVNRTVASLISRWDDDDFQVRESASKELVKIGMPAEPQLRKARESESAEVRIRARLARSAVMSPRPRANLTGHESEVGCAAFSPDGTMLASGDKAGIVKLWDASTLTSIATLDVKLAHEKEP
jgi:WD40 repeat protein